VDAEGAAAGGPVGCEGLEKDGHEIII
jgi:hypothetical protein